MVRLRDFEFELHPQCTRTRKARERPVRDTAQGKRARAGTPAEPRRRRSAGSASISAGDSSTSACKHANSACKGVKRRSRGPAAAARSKARLQAFNERKREHLLAASQLRKRLKDAVRRMRFERMWMVKRAHAQGKIVAPSLSEAMASFFSTSVMQQPPQEEAGSKRAATSTPTSPPPQAASLAVQGVKPSPLKKPRSGRKKCTVCGTCHTYTCTCKYKNTGFRRLQIA